MAQSTIAQFESGARSPSVKTLETLAEAFGVEVADFFPRTQSPLPFAYPTEPNEAGGVKIKVGETDTSGIVDSVEIKTYFEAIVAALEAQGRFDKAEEVGRLRDEVLAA
jgi:transcriptional regulator with XRE-family HTH domain